MWLKYQRVYYNLDQVTSVSFRANTLAFNLKTASYIQIQVHSPLNVAELNFIREMFETALELRNDIFDLDKINEKFKTERTRVSTITR